MNDRILILDDGAIDPRGRLDSHRKHRPPEGSVAGHLGDFYPPGVRVTTDDRDS
jgi:hypothetical protein